MAADSTTTHFIKTDELHSVGHRLEILLGPYAPFLEQKGNALAFGGQRASRGSIATGLLLIIGGLLLYGLVLLRMDGWAARVFGSLGGTVLLYTGTFLLRYYHAVILDQDKRIIYQQTRREKVKFADFSDVKHFKQTEHRTKGRYRATTLSVVLKDRRELRLLTYRKDKVPENFPTEINRLLWSWLYGKKEA